MKDIINLKKLTFNYGTISVFNGFYMEVIRGEWISIVGPNGSGKSTLIKLLTGLIEGHGIIQIDGLILNSDNVQDIRRKIGVVFSNSENTFVAETVADELAFPLENLEYSSEEIKEKINEISKKIGLTKILECEPHRLSGGEKQLVALGVALMTDPKMLILDEALAMLDNVNKEKIVKHLKKLHEEGMTIINVTQEIEETIFGDKIVVLKKGKKVIEGPTMMVYKEEKILNRLGFDLPFMIDLSYKLRFYGLIDKDYLDMKELVNALWK